ncbi:MAG: GntR family transcriptional regulator [Pseudomonadota bacterium]
MEDDFEDRVKEAEKPVMSRSEQAYAAIQQMIITGELPAYELISENDLTRRTGCGRTPVREALQRLSFEGFVDVLPRRGIMVTPADINRQLELLETRRPLEELMVTLGAGRASPEQRERMRELADELERAVGEQDRTRYLEINRAIHEVEAAAASNRFLQRQIAVIHSLSRRFWYSVISDTESFAAAAHWHAQTLRAIASGDAEAARRCCHELMDLLDNASRDAIGRRGYAPRPSAQGHAD